MLSEEELEVFKYLVNSLDQAKRDIENISTNREHFIYDVTPEYVRQQIAEWNDVMRPKENELNTLVTELTISIQKLVASFQEGESVSFGGYVAGKDKSRPTVAPTAVMELAQKFRNQYQDMFFFDPDAPGYSEIGRAFDFAASQMESLIKRSTVNPYIKPEKQKGK